MEEGEREYLRKHHIVAYCMQSSPASPPVISRPAAMHDVDHHGIGRVIEMALARINPRVDRALHLRCAIVRLVLAASQRRSRVASMSTAWIPPSAPPLALPYAADSRSGRVCTRSHLPVFLPASIACLHSVARSLHLREVLGDGQAGLHGRC